MKLLYIFPHPDDESFGPAGAIYQQIRSGHEVHLLTLTRGGATKMRFRYNLSEEQMGEVRLKEMQKVQQVLELSGMTVWNLPDGELAHMEPISLEDKIKDHIQALQPDIVVTYAVHGVSGHPDHLTTHAVVKRVYCDLKRNNKTSPSRLALFTLPREDKENQDEKGGNFQVTRSKEKYIDCVIKLTEEDRIRFLESLDAYETFKEVVEETRVKEVIQYDICFEIFNENHKPPLKNLEEKL